MNAFQKNTVLAGALLLASGSFASSSAPQVKLPDGSSLKGSQCAATNVQSFRGIPYAQPPTGSLRFMAPKALDGPIKYDGDAFDATKAAAPCLQFYSEFRDTNPTPSEDCLTVDIYMPANATEGAKLPVLVWAYGGFNKVGGTSYPLYDGCNLATSAVLVELNYRVGPMGFLSLGSAGIQGNMAIQDTLAALEWVQTNAAAFGGDASKAMLFGQSAGADNAFVISTLPQAPDLMIGAIAESGGGQFLTPWSVAQDVGAGFAKSVNCSTRDSASYDALQAAYAEVSLSKAKIPGQIFADQGNNIPRAQNMANSILDGKIIKDEPLKVGSKVPIVVGNTQQDAALFVLPEYVDSKYPTTVANYTEFIGGFGPEVAKEIEKRYPLSAYNTTGSTTDAVIAAISDISTISTYTCQSYYVLQAAAAAGTPAYAYRFNHTPSCAWLDFPGAGGFFPPKQDAVYVGAAHTSEIPYIFGNLDNMPFNLGKCNSSEAEYLMGTQLRSSWTAMAATGNPSSSLLNWPEYDPCDHKGVWVQDMAYDITFTDLGQCAFWGNLWQTLQGETLPYLSGNDGCTAGSNSTSTSTSTATSSSSSSSTGSTSTTVPVSGSSRTYVGALSTILGLLVAVFITSS